MYFRLCNQIFFAHSFGRCELLLGQQIPFIAEDMAKELLLDYFPNIQDEFLDYVIGN